MLMVGAYVALVCPAMAVPPVAVKVTVPGPQLDPGVTLGADGTGLIVATTDVLLLSQVPLSIDT